MAMSKCISKKILIFLFAIVASLCMVFPCLTLHNASAKNKVNYYAAEQTVDGTTDIESVIAEITADIENYKTALDSIVVVDEADSALNEMLALTRAYFDGGDYDFVQGSLYGDYGLKGILGIYEVAYEFYLEYVYVDEVGGNTLTSAAQTRSLIPSVNKVLIEKATAALTSYSATDFANDSTEGAESLPYKKSRADAWVQDFIADDEDGFAYVLSIQSELSSFKNQRIKRLDYVRSYYFSDKYDSAYVNLEVYQSDADVSQERLQEVKDAVTEIYKTEEDVDAVKLLIEEKVDEYEGLFVGLNTAIERVYDEVHAKSNANSGEGVSTLDLIAQCEAAFTSFETLGTIEGYEKVAGDKYESVEIDLQTGKPVGTGNSTSGDLKVALDLVTDYKALVKRAIDESKNALQEGYGVASEALTSSYINYAKGLADGLTGYYGRLTPAEETAPVVNGYKANQYSYTNLDGETVQVVCGSDIVRAFNDSPFCEGALVVVDRGELKRSTPLSEFKFKSTVIDSSNSAYEISLTCIDEGGNPVDFFQPDAKLTVREGSLPSIERNLYLILKGDRLEQGTKGLSEEDRAYLKGRVLNYYFKFTITSSTIKAGKQTVLEFEPINVRITIKFNDSKEFEALKQANACALNYLHANVNKVYKDIEWGENTMTFNVNNFTNQFETAVASTGKAPFDWTTYIVLGVVGLVALLFVIWLLVAIIRNWKYKVIFNANGGKFNSCIKVKLHEKFNHPTPPYRKGYKFLGWFADSKCTVRFAASELTKRHKVKVYAKWMSDEEYEKLNEKYVGASAPAGVNNVWLDPAVNAKRDTNLEKIEAEKLSYEAKRAEEERRTEEVKLQAIREIDEAKKNDEARAKAEQEAEEAKAELAKALADRDELIKNERADERAKCIEEMKSVGGEGDVDYEAAIARAKAETEEKLRKEFDEESRARAEEQAKINEELLNKIKALEESKAREEEEARIRAEEKRINDAIAAGVAAKLAELALERFAAAPVATPAPQVVAEPVAEEAPAFDTKHAFEELKAEMCSYVDADDLGFSLEECAPACVVKVVGETVELEVNLDLEDCSKKAYKTVQGENLPVKFVLTSDDDMDEAEELIAEAMLESGLKQAEKAEAQESTEEERAQGFAHGVSKDKLADTPEEFYKLLRVHAKSFVYADDEEVEEKLLMKMFLRRNKVYLYLNHGAEGLKECDAEMAVAGLKTFMTIKSADDCKEAMKLISAMMRENGLIRYPSEVKIAEEDCAKGFTYVLSK